MGAQPYFLHKTQKGAFEKVQLLGHIVQYCLFWVTPSLKQIIMMCSYKQWRLAPWLLCEKKIFSNNSELPCVAIILVKLCTQKCYHEWNLSNLRKWGVRNGRQNCVENNTTGYLKQHQFADLTNSYTKHFLLEKTNYQVMERRDEVKLLP